MQPGKSQMIECCIEMEVVTRGQSKVYLDKESLSTERAVSGSVCSEFEYQKPLDFFVQTSGFDIFFFFFYGRTCVQINLGRTVVNLLVKRGASAFPPGNNWA